MTNGRNETMGRIVARAWSDPDFKKRLLAETMAALMELDMAIPAGKTVVAVENTASLVHIVLTAPRFTETLSAYSEIKAFGESYRDIRLFPLNWGSHDPIFTAKFKLDPKAALRRMGVEVSETMSIEVVENSATRVYLVLPATPPEPELSEDILERVASGLLPPAIRYAAIEGPVSYHQFF